MPVPVKIRNNFILEGFSTVLRDPHVTALNTGGFVIGYQHDRTATDRDVRYNLRDFRGDLRDVRLQTGLNGDGLERAPTAVDGTNGVLVQVFSDDSSSPPTRDIVLQQRNLTTGDLGTPVTIISGFFTERPEVVRLTGGRYAVAYIDTDETGQVLSRVWDPLTNTLSPLVSLGSTADQGEAAFDLGMTALSTGNYAVSWRTNANNLRLSIVSSSNTVVAGPGQRRAVPYIAFIDLGVSRHAILPPVEGAPESGLQQGVNFERR